MTITDSVTLRDNAELAIVELPLLESTGQFGLELQSNPKVVRMEAPMLRRVGDLEVENNAMLEHFSAPLLTTVDGEAPTGDASIFMNPALDELTIPALETVVGTLVIANNPRLGAFELAGVVELGSLSVRDNGALERVSLPGVTISSALSILGNQRLQSVAMVDLVELRSDLRVIGNPALSALDLPALTTMGSDDSVNVRQNPALPMCVVDAIVAQLEGFEGHVSTSDNAATCP